MATAEPQMPADEVPLIPKGPVQKEGKQREGVVDGIPVALEAEKAPTAAAATAAAPWAPSFMMVCLIVVFAFLTRAGHPLIAGMSKGNGTGGKHEILYSLAWLLVLNSLLKLIVCGIALPIQYKVTPANERANLVAWETKTFFYYLVPAVLYQVSDVAYVLMLVVMNPALGLPMASLKILATGILVHVFSKFKFGRHIFNPLNDIQWIALGLLLVGVVLTTPMGKVDPKSDKGDAMGNVGLGFIWALVYSVASALANVGTELLFKRALEEEGEDDEEAQVRVEARVTQGLLLQNIQLYFWATIVCLAYMFIKEGRDIVAKGPFHDFNAWVWGLLILDSCGGLIASLVFKYLNNITFLFINVACMVAATLLSVPLFKFDFSATFAVALVVIFLATYLYKREDILETAKRLWNFYVSSVGLTGLCFKCKGSPGCQKSPQPTTQGAENDEVALLAAEEGAEDQKMR